MLGYSWRRNLLATLGLLVVLALFAACTQATPVPTSPTAKPAAKESTPSTSVAPAGANPTPTSPAAPKPAKPTGQITIVVPDLSREVFDPSLTRSLIRTNDVGGPIYESLFMTFPPDGAIRPLLLESGTSTPDGLSWTFKLRDGIRFSNGDPMTAEDVKFSFDRYRSPEAASLHAGEFRQTIRDVVVLDRLTVRVDLSQPIINMDLFLASSGNEGIVLPKKYIEQVGWEGFNRKPIGSGPYKMAEHKPGESITYEAVENHWRTTPAFARVQVFKVAEERSRIAMLKAGQADLVLISPGTVREVEQAGFKPIVIPYGGMAQINFYGAFGKYPPGPTSKVEVRWALDLAINKQEILDTLFAGAGTVAAVTPSAPGFSVGTPKDLKPTPYDPEEAKRLLRQAGYPNGFEITFYSVPLARCLDTQLLVEAVAGYWEKVGVKARIRPMEYTVFRPLFSGKEHAPEIVGTAANHCATIGELASAELGVYYWSKGVVKLTDVADAEVEKAQAAKSVEEQVRYAEAAYRKVYENHVVIPLNYTGLVYAGTPKVADLLPITPGVDTLSFWLTQEKR